jgi:hypothetical protein
MTNHVGRLYSLALAVVVFFVLWAAIAAKPWATTATDPRLAALVAREHQLRHDAVLVKKVVAGRWAVYRVQLAHRKAAIAAAQQRQLATASYQAPAAGYSGGAAPAVRVVMLPPLTITRTS